MNVVAGVERGLRIFLAPDKINLASLGNAVPHLHWHVIPRYRDDSHFPEAIWGALQREGATRELPRDFAAKMKQELDAALA
jgi:diadenosine tetraphosphate (Ap4A) HIT family hydrolase